MEISQFPELCFNSPSQWPLNSSFDDDELNMMELAVAFGGDDHHLNMYSHDAPMFNHYYYYNKPPPPPPPPHVMEPIPSPPAKQLKTSSSSNSSWNSCISTSHQSMMNNILPNPKEELGTVSSSKTIICDTQFGKSPATTPQAHHILAERKRREKLSQRFIALSALIPGLKKMDKASVLGDAIKHLKTLQEKLKALEEQANKKSSTESVVFVTIYEVLADHIHGGEISSSDDHNFLVHDQLPQVEARFSGKDVLIRVHCEKKAGVVQETLALIQKFHLSVINTTAITFASYALDITVVAQMDQDFTMTMKDLVKNLRTSLK